MSKRLVEYESFKENPYSLDKDKHWIRQNAKNHIQVVDTSTGEVSKRYELFLSDRKPYIKLFIDSLPVFQMLSYKGSRVFFEMLMELKKGEDEVYLNSKSLSDKFKLKNTRDVLAGIKELLDLDVISKKTEKDVYFINIRMVFNGDRVKYMDERVK